MKSIKNTGKNADAGYLGEGMPHRDVAVVNNSMKPDHQIVWQALEAAVTAWKRVVSAAEIVKALTPVEKKRLEEKYVKPLPLAVCSVLELLERRGLAFVKKGKRFRYYGSVRLLPAETSQPPEERVSRRQKTLELAMNAVKLYKRAVRADDVLELGKSRSLPVSRLLIVRDLRNLAATGELQIVKAVRGDGGGRNLYLPNKLNSEVYLEAEALTWLEAFNVLWKEHEAQAVEGKAPQPVTTAEIRARLEAAEAPHPRLREPKAVTNAMKQLSETASPLVKRVKVRATGAVTWVLAAFDNEKDNIGYGGSNSDRIAIAVQKAEARLERPVNAEDVNEEIKADAYLVPAGKQSVARLLSEISKQKIADGSGGRRERITALVYAAGKANGKTYFVAGGSNLEKAGTYVEYLNWENAWQKLIEVENVAAIETCQLPSVKQGRMLLLQKQANEFRFSFLGLLSSGNLNSVSRYRVERLLRETEAMVTDIERWLRANPNTGLPNEVDASVAGWTSKELYEAYRLLYPSAAAVKNINRMIILCGSNVRRIANQNFSSRFSSDPLQAAEYLYDRTDALINAALRWGGKEARFQGTTARAELGLLRDARFVLPELNSNNYEMRIATISCLAFLQPEEISEKLYSIAQSDPLSQVRCSALWAYAFTGGIKPGRRALGITDSDARVRELAKVIAGAYVEELWFI